MTAVTGTVTHVAGLDVSFGDYLRQRCAWCGALLIDQDLTRVARPVEDAALPFPIWRVGALVEVTSGNPEVSQEVGGEPSETGDGIRGARLVLYAPTTGGHAVSTPPLDAPRMTAGIDLLGRTGATDFQIRYCDDPRAALRWDDPASGVPSQRHRGCDLHALEFPSIHAPLPRCMYLERIYTLLVQESIPRRNILDRCYRSSHTAGYGAGAGLGVGVRALRAHVAASGQKPRAQGLPPLQESVLEPAEATSQGVLRCCGRDWVSWSSQHRCHGRGSNRPGCNLPIRAAVDTIVLHGSPRRAWHSHCWAAGGR